MNSEVLNQTFEKPEFALKAIMDGLPVGVGVFAEMKPLYLNTTLLNMIGKTESELNESGLENLFNHEHDNLREICKKIESGSVMEHVWEMSFTPQNDDERTYKGFMNRIELDGKNVLLITLRDMTQQKKAEIKAREQTELFHLIGENSGDFIYVHDPKSKLSYVSPGVENITGYPADDWDQHSGRYLVNGSNRDKAIEMTTKALETGEKQPTYTVDIITADKRKRTLEVNETPYRKKNQVVGIVGVARDITERLEYAEKLERMNKKLEKHNEKLGRANQEMEAFIYTVSHDLKAPLVTLHGMTDRLQKKFGNSLDARGQHYIERIRVNIERLEELVLDLLELSRIGRIEEPKEEFDAVECVQEALQISREQVDSSELRVEFPRNLGKTHYSKKRLRQVFTNLITNAAKYKDSDRQALLTISGEPKDGMLLIKCQDNGRGIDEKFHKKIFGAFQRPGSRKNDEGSGIGLTIVKRVIEYNGGKIWVESALNEGSTFYFTIPYAD